MPKALFPILAVTLVDVLGFTILIPLLPFYAEHYGASPQTIGLIYVTVAACSLISSPIYGRLSDRLGRKGVLLAAQIASAIGFTLLGIGGSLTMIFIARAIEGLGGGGLGVTQAYISDVTTPENRARAFGLVGATFGIGFLIGPALGGALVRFGYAVPLFVAAGLAVVTIILTLTLLPESHKPLDTPPALSSIGEALRRPTLGALVLTQFAFALAFTGWVTIFALFVERALHYGPSSASLIFVVSSIVGIIVQGVLIGRIVDRFGEGRTAIAGLCCGLIAYAGVPLITSTPILMVFVFFWSLSGALIRPSLGALISRAAPAAMRGTVLGANDALNNLAFVIAPLISTAVLASNFRLVGILPVVATLLAIAIGYRVFTRPEETLATASAS